MTTRIPDPESELPLPAAMFHILMALADEDRHGYAIIQEVAARTNGDVRLSAGTLYRTLQRLLDQDYVHELTMRERPARDADDARRRYYRLTPYGRAVAEAETRRLGALLRLARASGFVPRKA
jgi:DNA-binding PadR family transcriptional regulator